MIIYFFFISQVTYIFVSRLAYHVTSIFGLAVVFFTGKLLQVNITKEDQVQINQFARYNQRLQELVEAVKNKQEESQKLQDAGEELMLSMLTL